MNMKIKQQYINTLQHCHTRFLQSTAKITYYEQLIKETHKQILDWSTENAKVLQRVKDKEQNTEEDVTIVENQVDKYTKIIKSLSDNIKPFLEETEQIKKDIDEVYSRIMKEYSNQYTEEEIIEYIQKQLNQ